METLFVVSSLTRLSTLKPVTIEMSTEVNHYSTASVHYMNLRRVNSNSIYTLIHPDLHYGETQLMSYYVANILPVEIRCYHRLFDDSMENCHRDRCKKHNYIISRTPQPTGVLYNATIILIEVEIIFIDFIYGCITITNYLLELFE